MKHQQIIIKGKVENTGFRFYAFRGASMLGIRGFVMLNEDHVIVEAEGEDSKLADFGEWCRKGPEGSTVESLIYSDKKIIGYEDFKIL
jgi:acylphosphatase